MCGIPIVITLPLNFFIPGANEQRSDSAPQRYFFIDQQDRCVDWESRLAGRFFWLVVEPTLWETSFSTADGRNPTWDVSNPVNNEVFTILVQDFWILEYNFPDSLGDPKKTCLQPDGFPSIYKGLFQLDGHFFQLFTLKNGWKSPNIHETMVVLGFQVVVLKQSKQSLVCPSIAKKLSKILKNLLLKFYSICTLPETNSSHLKVDGWKTRKFPFGSFWGPASFRGANC